MVYLFVYKKITSIYSVCEISLRNIKAIFNIHHFRNFMIRRLDNFFYY